MDGRPHLDEAAAFGRIGRIAAIICAIGALLYGLASVLIGIAAPAAITFDTWSDFIAEYSAIPTLLLLTPPFVVALAFPVLVVAIHYVVGPERQPITLLAIVFAAIYTAVLGMAYWLQLTFVPQSLAEGNTEGLALWVAWHPRSFFWAFESFGYFSMGVASFSLSMALRGTSASRTARVALGALGPLGLAFMFNEAIGSAAPLALVLGLVFVWVVLTTVATAALAWSFGPIAAEQAARTTSLGTTHP